MLLNNGLWERRFNLITKQKKSKQIEEISERFARSKAVVFTEYKGLTVSEISNLRMQIKEVDGEYKVVKNTLTEIAARGTPIEAARSYLNGPTGIAFGYSDPIAIAKKVLEFSTNNEKFKIKSGIIEGRLYTIEELKAVSQLPSRKTLLGMFAASLQAPTAKLAYSLSATINQLAYALESLKNKKEQSGGN